MTTLATPTSRQSESGPIIPLPPHSVDAEMSLLGSMTLNRDAIGLVLPIIGRQEADWFYQPGHYLLYEVLVDLYDGNQPIDLVVVKDELKRRNLLEQVGGVGYLVQLAESVPSWVNAEYYARIVRDKGLLRDLIRCAGEISQSAYADDQEVAKLLDEAEQRLFQVTQRRVSGRASALRELLKEIYEKIKPGEGSYLTGLASGFTQLDDLTSGFQRGDFIVIAGRPSMGKTALGLNIAENMAIDDKRPVVFFSLEMSRQQLAQRVLCGRGRIDSHRFRRGMVSEEEKQQLGFVCAELEQAPLYIDDTPGISVLELRAKARRLAQQHDIQAVFTDYLQLMTAPSSSDNRQQEISAISRGLKALGRELNVPIIAMAQLNRMSEGREGHRPRMSDLRESGAIEQDADVVLLLHREEYYKRDDPTVKGLAELIIEKQRNGPTATIELVFDRKLTSFRTRSFEPEPAGSQTYVEDGPF
ncbi:MAG: replicative DNA helicase [Phycisphaerae bacterium]|nr:replicative DNA helicase [Phycisphaerae bacterium]